MGQLDYIVTGTGRSGTVFIADLLTSAGLPCGHEAIFTNRGWEAALARLRRPALVTSEVSGSKMIDKPIADSSYMAAPYLDKMNATVIHVVRDPLKVINSFINAYCYFLSHSLECSDGDNRYAYAPGADPDFAYQTFIYHHLPGLRQPMNPWLRACLYYVEWNEMIERTSNKYIFHRLEDDPAILLAALGLPSKNVDCTPLNVANKPETCTLSTLPDGIIKDRFVAIGKKYGYWIKHQ